MEKIPIRHIKITHNESDFSESYSIRDIDSLLGGRDMDQKLHRHDFFHILILKEGEGSHDIDFSSFKIINNSVFVLRPGQVHKLILKAGSTGYMVQFKADFYPQDKVFSRLLRKASQVNHYQLTSDRFQKLLNTLDAIFYEYIGKEEGYKDVIKANMNIFFVELGRQLVKKPSDKADLYVQERLDSFWELLEMNIYKNKDVSEYAALLNLTPYQLNSITKTTLGKTCSEVINDQIILEAKRHLLATTNQINQIAYQLGYEDVSYFIRFFKKQTGYSPESFRKNFL